MVATGMLSDVGDAAVRTRQDALSFTLSFPIHAGNPGVVVATGGFPDAPATRHGEGGGARGTRDARHDGMVTPGNDAPAGDDAGWFLPGDGPLQAEGAPDGGVATAPAAPQADAPAPPAARPARAPAENRMPPTGPLDPGGAVRPHDTALLIGATIADPHGSWATRRAAAPLPDGLRPAADAAGGPQAALPESGARHQGPDGSSAAPAGDHAASGEASGTDAAGTSADTASPGGDPHPWSWTAPSPLPDDGRPLGNAGEAGPVTPTVLARVASPDPSSSPVIPPPAAGSVPATVRDAVLPGAAGAGGRAETTDGPVAGDVRAPGHLAAPDGDAAPAMAFTMDLSDDLAADGAHPALPAGARPPEAGVVAQIASDLDGRAAVAGFTDGFAEVPGDWPTMDLSTLTHARSFPGLEIVGTAPGAGPAAIVVHRDGLLLSGDRAGAAGGTDAAGDTGPDRPEAGAVRREDGDPGAAFWTFRHLDAGHGAANDPTAHLPLIGSDRATAWDAADPLIQDLDRAGGLGALLRQLLHGADGGGPASAAWTMLRDPDAEFHAAYLDAAATGPAGHVPRFSLAEHRAHGGDLLG